MEYVVLRINKKQYLLSEGEEFLVGRLGEEKPVVEILLYKDSKGLVVGKPVVDGAKVDLETIKEEEKGLKVDIFKYKAKSRYRKRMGFRPVYTRLLLKTVTLK